MTTESTSFEDTIDYTDLENRYKVAYNDCYDNIVIIDNLPRVDATKDEKLLAVLRKNLFAAAGAVALADGTYMPRDEATGLSRGYLFVEFETVEQAAAVFKLAQGFRLDKAHVLSAFKFTDYERLTTLDESFVAPETEPFVEREFLKSWLMDPMARDQFVTVSGNQTSIFNNNRDAAPELAYGRASWTDGMVRWSPRGSFLTTFHGQGVALWGGASWGKLARFPHPMVKGAFFSPRETYLVTQSPFNPAAPGDANVLVWEVQTGKLMRGFQVEELQEEDVERMETQCVLQWSHDEAHASRVLPDSIAIYELPQFTLLDKKGLRVEGAREVSWSPADAQLVYWVPGNENTPSRVALWHLPSRQVVRTKNLFNVHDIAVHWHAEGDFLAIQVDRYVHKNRKALATNIEIFRLRVKDIPVEVVECGGGERIHNFVWEPQGGRFLTNQTIDFKNIVSIYSTGSGKDASSVQLLKTLERKQLTRFAWSPRGDFFVMAGLDSTSAFLEFWTATDFTMLATKEHFMATDLEWDPSGRFVASWVSYWKHQMENGFMLWDFKGELVSKQSQPRFTHFSWRPRPPTLLPKAQIKDVRKNLKTYAARFEEEDARTQHQSHTDVTENKRKMLEEWVMYRVKCQTALDGKTKLRESIVAAGGRNARSSESKIVQEWIEDEVVETVEEIIADDC